MSIIESFMDKLTTIYKKKDVYFNLNRFSCKLNADKEVNVQ